MNEERMGFVGIVLDDHTSVEKINLILSEYAFLVQGRIGVPNHQTGEAVIGLIIRGTNDQLGALTGKLGNLPGVQVKSALSTRKQKE